ncbi:MAG: class I SAM-dependent methyltransferase [Bacteroidota bacterium]|nr:class I SAM-dependent methyltransferase [Bacteroidota bacterium]
MPGIYHNHERAGCRTTASPPMILDVGCGMRKRAGAVGIDINPRSCADVIHDLNVTPYPFPEDRFEEIVCDNVLEHVDDVVKVMEELYRIAKPDARMTIIVPFYVHRNANTDPTHKHFFGVHSFDYFVEGTAHSDFRYSSARLELLSVEFDRDLKGHWFDKIFRFFANRKKDFYENRLANIFPMRNLTFTLRVKK